jgi:HK97 family phage portal protein
MSLLSWLRGDDLTRRDLAPPSRRAAVPMLPAYRVGKPAWQDATVPVMTTEGYRRCVTAFACLNLIADAVAEATLRVYRDLGNGEREELADSGLRHLMQRPNPTKGEYEFLAYLIRQAGIAGFSAWQKVRSGAGRPVQLWPFDPLYLTPVLRDMAEPDWRYKLPGNPERVVTAEDVFVWTWMDALSPTDPTGDTPMRAVLREAGIATDLTDFIKLTLDRGGAPMFVIVATLPDGAEPLEDAEVEALRERFAQRYGGVANWTGPAYIEGASIQPLGFDLNQMAFKDLRGQVDSAVCSAFRVPMQVIQTVLGQESSTYSNYRDALRMLQMYTCGPLRARLDGAVTRGLLPEFETDPRVSVEFDTSRVEALQESQDDKHRRAVEALRAGGIQLDTFLEETGRRPVGGPLGESFYLPFSVVVTPPTGPEEEPEAEGGGLPPEEGDDDRALYSITRAEFWGAARQSGWRVPESGRATDEAPVTFVAGLGAGRRRPITRSPNGHVVPLYRLPETRKRSAAAAAKQTIARLGAKGAPALRRFFRQQGERVVAAATRSATVERLDLRTRMRPGEEPEGVRSRLVGFGPYGGPTVRDVAEIDWGDEERRLREVLTPLHAAAGETAYAAASDLIGVEISWDLANPNIRNVLDRLAGRVVGITQSTRDDVARVVGEALDEGVSLPELADRLTGLFEETYRGRALSVARTESMNAYGAASVLGYEESGVVGAAEIRDNPEHTDDYGASDGLTCASRHGIVVELARAYGHVEADHPNGSAVVLPVLSSPLGEA